MRPLFILPLIVLPLCFLPAGAGPSTTSGTPVTAVGAMREVMWGSRMEALFDLDTLKDRRRLYGLGPLDSLRGEILILDGRAYRSTVRADGRILVEETFASKAPFFVYSRPPRWTQVELPDSLFSLPELESLLNRLDRCRERPCTFKLAGKVRKAGFHVVDLPPGAAVKTPADAHKGMKRFTLEETQADMVGYFSTRHQGVFTHHDSFLHIHLITADRSKMGHLEWAEFDGGGMKLSVAGE